MRFGVNLPGPFWASWRVGGRRRPRGRVRAAIGLVFWALIAYAALVALIHTL